MKRSVLKPFFQIMFIIAGLFIVLAGISLYMDQDRLSRSPIFEHIFSKKVEQYRPLVAKHAEKYEIEDYVDVLLAMMMQESGGRGDDPMQSSESLCGEVGCIEDPEESIEQGVAYFSRIFEASGGEVELSVQAYNFGIGFVGFVQDKDQGFDQDLAIEFSKRMYDKAENPSEYSCLRDEAKEYDACYGDIYYARDVMAYQQQFSRKD